ncbi:beta-ketoacyl-ACP synthase III [Pseudovibrio sp. Ad37]|uniref:beta-ketoacyl-ACP synthase III n=1 Tax=Pseudovibrio sp. Ad37 TaxID=989422 RepID=UPI0007AEC281|nr:beta-ketoacyl-ACP synthase III [Pseudovibrio sp. Ad37]KZL23643.1 3-oxoacyl-[acyl-carrier-protein] synthase 3 [Pseudovibrio sp. Ad37]
MNSFKDRGGLIGFGHYAPERRVLNAEIEQDLGLEEGWIERRTGIRERRYVSSDQALTDIALPAAQMAIEDAGIDPAKIGLTLLATSTPDHLLPPSAPLLVHKLGLPNSGGIDMAGACAGFLYALAMADAYAKAQGIAVLVVAANILSRRINPVERASRVLFADAAGAVVVLPPAHKEQGILAADLASDGAYYDLIKIPGGGSRNPYRPDMAPNEYLMSLQGGQTVFAKAVNTLTDSAMKILGQADIKPSEVDHWAPHQANSRIIQAVGTNLGINADKTLITLGEYGNSSAATIPFSLSKCRENRSYKAGDKILLSAIGAGFVSGSLLIGM